MLSVGMPSFQNLLPQCTPLQRGPVTSEETLLSLVSTFALMLFPILRNPGHCPGAGQAAPTLPSSQGRGQMGPGTDHPARISHFVRPPQQGRPGVPTGQIRE